MEAFDHPISTVSWLVTGQFAVAFCLVMGPGIGSTRTVRTIVGATSNNPIQLIHNVTAQQHLLRHLAKCQIKGNAGN
ncbi:uncharacterized protein DEA37_0014396 [Paragonimus westermani]|uniref:Uncharacterized protein n=1 Tax=Paragonimus westermani TaxID=34504 RepID=A0A5J4NXD9_9TREM|nr:uncharacterized protein DEA37_0014396 [Paragonimus westermani]